MNSEPSLSDLCGFCNHKFGRHYSTFDDKNGGCLHVDDSPYHETCHCKGFGIIYRPRVRAFTGPSRGNEEIQDRPGGRKYGDNRDFGQESPFPERKSC